MQHVNRPAHIQWLPEPTRTARPCVDTQALRVVRLSERLDWIFGHRRPRRHLGQRVAVRSPELEGAVGQARDLVALLVNGAVVPATE